MPNFGEREKLCGKLEGYITFGVGVRDMTTDGVFWQLESPRKFTESDTVSLGFKSFKLSKAGRGQALPFVMVVAKWERLAT